MFALRPVVPISCVVMNSSIVNVSPSSMTANQPATGSTENARNIRELECTAMENVGINCRTKNVGKDRKTGKRYRLFSLAQLQ